LFINLTPAKRQSKEATLSSLENLSLAETSLSEHYVSNLFSDQSQQQDDEFMEEWAAQQSSVDAGNLQEQPNGNNRIKIDNLGNVSIGQKKEEQLEDQEEELEDEEEMEIEGDDNSFRARMQRKPRQQIASKIRQMQEDNVAFKNDDEFQVDFELDTTAAKELAEAKIVIAQTLMDLHENDALEANASFVLQVQKLSEHYNLGGFGYLVGQYGSIPLERIDEHGRMNYHLAQEDAQGKRRSLDDNAWWDPPNANDEKDHFGFGPRNVEKQPLAQKAADEDNGVEEKQLYSENFVESLRAAIESFENMVKAEIEARRMPNQLIGGILSIEVTSFFWNILFLYQMMIQHVVARFRLGLQRHNNNFAVPRSIIFAMTYLTDQVQTLIYSQGDPRNSDSFSLSKSFNGNGDSFDRI
jgi:hypothetical protein